MSTTLRCPACDLKLTLPDDLPASRRVQCSGCRRVFTRAEAASPPTLPPAPPGTDEPDWGGPTGPRRQRGGGSVVLKAVVAVLLLALIGGGVAASVYYWNEWEKEKAERAANAPAGGAPMPQGKGGPPPGMKMKGFPGKPEPKQEAAPGPDGWLQDLEKAKAQAAREKKDILLCFDGSDWCPFSQQLADEVLLRPEFASYLDRHFVPVFIDDARTPLGVAKVQDPKRNARVMQEYGVGSLPLLVAADAEGRPYAWVGYVQGGVPTYEAAIDKMREARVARDKKLEAVAKAEGLAKFPLALEAFEHLKQRGVNFAYRPLLAEWHKLARDLDPDNAHGHLEAFFALDWAHRAVKAGKDEAGGLLAEFDAFRKARRFKDRDRGAEVHLRAAQIQAGMRRYEEALRTLGEGLEYRPNNPGLAQALRNGPQTLGLFTATGLVLTADGHVLTNAHVVGQPVEVYALLPGGKKLAAAEVVAADRGRDLALLKLKDLPAGVKFQGKGVVSREPRRGEDVAVLGYPLGHAFGAGLKLTKGAVSSVPEAGAESKFFLDVKINPGNSGSPVCDPAGNVVGLVSARTFSQGGALESYGIAITGAEVNAFLKEHLPGYAPPAAASEKGSWEAVDRAVSPSVVMLLQAPAPVPTTK